MKKVLFKAMAAAVAMAAFVACTDDLGMEQYRAGNAKADLTATFNESEATTRMGMLELEGGNPWELEAKGNGNSGWRWVFTENDQVRVWSMKSMSFELYELTGEANTGTGKFSLANNQQFDTESGEKYYAVMDAQFAYSIAPNEYSKPVLTYTIPYQYTATTIDAGKKEADMDNDGEKEEHTAWVRKLPSPFWGEVNITGEGANRELDVNLEGLTSFLRIEMEDMPEGTQYIVLTTHGRATKDGDADVEYDGFQLLEPDPDYTWSTGGTSNHVKGIDGAFNLNKLTNWYDENGDALGEITDGNSEPLSGTFNAILTTDKEDVNYPSKLKVDEGLSGDEYGMGGISRLVTRDELVVKLEKDKEGKFYPFWIPVISQHYNNLHVIAVVDKPSKYAYKYIGKELKVYTDEEFIVKKRYKLTMNLTQKGKVCAHELNEAIKNINQENKFKFASENIINVDELIDCPHTYKTNGVTYNGHKDDNVFPTDQILIQGKGDLVLNIAKISATAQIKKKLSPVRSDLESATATGKTQVLFVSDHNYWKDNDPFRTSRTSNVQGSVTINLPAGWVTSDEAANDDSTADDQNGGNENDDQNGGNQNDDNQNDGDQTNSGEGGSGTNGVNANDQDASQDGTYNNSSRFTRATEETTTTTSVADVAARALLSELPNYNVVIAVNNNYAPASQTAGKELDVYAYGSKTQFVTGHDLKPDDSGNIKDETQAAIKVVNGIGTLNVMKGTQGDVYVNKVSDAKVEIAKALYVYTTEGINIRIDDGLVRNIYFPQDCGNNENYVISTASGAIGYIGVIDSENAVPNDVNVLSYWTGFALDAEAENIAEYDKGDVYTVAQLASMGEKITGSTTNSYKINSLLDFMWLGGSKYGWVGPQVTIGKFTFDGNNIGLYNMYMPSDVSANAYAGYDRTIYVYDPHICCTSCGWRTYAADSETEGKTSSDAIPLEYFGLIRSIKNEGDNVIKNVKLNDVHCDSKEDATVDAIGSLVGYVETTGKIDFELDNVGEVQIDVEKDYVGGLVGQIAKATDVTIKKSTVANDVYGTGYIEGVNYVGGLIGQAVSAERINSITIEDSRVEMGKNIDASGAYVGGLIGDVDAKTITVTNDKVRVKGNISTDGSYAGGLFGNVVADNLELTANSPSTVNVTGAIKAGNQYAGGLIGYSNVGVQRLLNATVKAGKVSAENGYVGGEVGYLYGGVTRIGTYVANETTNLVTNINIGTLAGAYAVGGLVGSNDENATVYVLADYCKDDPAYENGSFIDIKITKFENTKGDNQVDAEAYYKVIQDGQNKLAGTFSNVLGMLYGPLYINDELLTVEDNLQSEMKKAIGYQARLDGLPTYTEGARLFWGDYRGYVGAGKSGKYFICTESAASKIVSSATAIVGDQAGSLMGYNLYKSAEKYSLESNYDIDEEE